MKKSYPLLLLLAAALVSSCTLTSKNSSDSSSSEDTSESSESSSSSETSGTIEESPIKDPDYSYKDIAKKEDVTLDDLFNLHNRVEIMVDVDREELEKIQEDNYRGNKPEIYHLAKEVTINLTNNSNTFTWTFENVGIRQKGNLSRENIFNGDDLNPHNHYKLSFDETFDDPEMYDNEFISMYGDNDYKDRTFLGLSGLDFKWNRNCDETNIKEIYASYLYKSAGIITQKVGLSSLKIRTDNKETNFGVCFMYEPTSKSIIKRKFSENTNYVNIPTWKDENKGTYGVSGKKYGDFYKVTYGGGNGSYGGGGDLSTDSIYGKRVGVKTDIYGNDYPAYERKTNKDDAYNDDLIKAMVNNLDSYEEIDKRVDLEYFAIEEAVSYYVGNPDSFRYNYNNYMMYFRRTDGKMIVIPIDNDRTFGIGHTWDKGVTFSANESTTPLSKYDVSGNNNRNRLFQKTLLAKNNKCINTFNQYIQLIAESKWVLNETFTNYFNIAKETYESLATFNLSGGPDNISFKNYIAVKLKAADQSSGSETESETESESDSSSEFDINSPMVLDFENYYLAGDFNNLFGNVYNDISEAEDYFLKPSSTQPGSYEVTFTIQVNEGCYMSDNEIMFNFRNDIKDNWDDYFGVTAINDKVLIHNKEAMNSDCGFDSIKIQGVHEGDTLTFMIHPNNRSYSYSIK